MLDKLTNSLDFHTKALVLRADRQRLIASNIANADTPGYAARDMNFADAMRSATGETTSGSPLAMRTSAGTDYSTASAARHIALGAGSASGADGGERGYVVQTQPTLDGNSVDLDRERAAFADNAVRYEATLRFINGQSKTMLAAIQGQ
ncbi:flagellar basal body rod protein FlgB [Variovorax sp. PAMC 28711]|uniref:flagellar basal body rod protein FlgB n=1 Tax=Variovorax sp. PAMC 28711 TaxID=1795631 RepID=UPI00078C7F01|nr:flagellar basal body rod protein FlgB [Variovorax sp. PAMC 28711]AMM25013.1 flagellar biosynthesis protein FlgB [Variovorax sp. PAMC 28711]